MVFIYSLSQCMEDVKTIKDTTTKNWIGEEMMGGKIQIYEY